MSSESVVVSGYFFSFSSMLYHTQFPMFHVLLVTLCHHILLFVPYV